MKYLVDECLKLKKNIGPTKNYLFSYQVLGEGASDSKILEYAIKKNLTLITNDMKFALRTAMVKHPVIYYQRNGKSMQINTEEIEDLDRKFSGSLTFYALENDEVVIP